MIPWTPNKSSTVRMIPSSSWTMCRATPASNSTSFYRLVLWIFWRLDSAVTGKTFDSNRLKKVSFSAQTCRPQDSNAWTALGPLWKTWHECSETKPAIGSTTFRFQGVGGNTAVRQLEHSNIDDYGLQPHLKILSWGLCSICHFCPSPKPNVTEPKRPTLDIYKIFTLGDLPENYTMTFPIRIIPFCARWLFDDRHRSPIYLNWNLSDII